MSSIVEASSAAVLNSVSTPESPGTSAQVVLVRAGRMPEVERAVVSEGLTVQRGDVVILETPRGPLTGRVLEDISKTWRLVPHEALPAITVQRIPTKDDEVTIRELESLSAQEFMPWVMRIRSWDLDLELVDLEKTLDREKWILYVLAGRGPDCTKLALQAAAAGLGIIEVQPIQAAGTRPKEVSKGCGSSGGGCGCGS
ncbi:hypothetical protein Spb1_32600 [Planctopirus ephydatiae]|uniref:PSP1 C-terminal domain-containing protein n=1 Tax=Planctopirus ephydatiae TaxID=2528019 RepID=A0A518GRU1_9PLAN|nr:hypothetical protein Spb1_32600 [Planctopirus ephydatiae]